jgi:hypothetical protein
MRVLISIQTLRFRAIWGRGNRFCAFFDPKMGQKWPEMGWKWLGNEWLGMAVAVAEKKKIQKIKKIKKK